MTNSRVHRKTQNNFVDSGYGNPPVANTQPPLNPGLAALVQEAEVRRETLRIESAVNLAVAVTLRLLGRGEEGSITIAPQDLIDFQSKYIAVQELQEDGSFTISFKQK